MVLNKNQIKEIIPHREPFLLIDEVTALEEGKSADAKWALTGEEYFFKGHFPDTPVLPGVLMLESLLSAVQSLFSVCPKTVAKSRSSQVRTM